MIYIQNMEGAMNIVMILRFFGSKLSLIVKWISVHGISLIMWVYTRKYPTDVYSFNKQFRIA